MPRLCQQEKHAIGLEPSPSHSSPYPSTSQRTSVTVKDSKKLEPQATTISNSSSSSSVNSASLLFSNYLRDIGNPPVLREPLNMSGRKTPESPTPSLNTALSRRNAMSRRTGTLSGTQQQPAPLTLSLPTLEYVVTTHSKRLLVTILSLLRRNDALAYSGVVLEQGSRKEPGMKADYWLILKTLAPNGGMDTVVRNMLSLMNFEGPLESRIFYAGSTGIRLLWRVKDLRLASLPPRSGSRQTSTRDFGTQTLTPIRSPR